MTIVGKLRDVFAHVIIERKIPLLLTASTIPAAVNCFDTEPM